MIYSRGEIVWVKFPFSNSSTLKLRPALVISNDLVNRSGDYIMMQITTRLRKDSFSLAISETDFIGPPLLKASELRIHKVFVLNGQLITGAITKVSENFMAKMVSQFIRLIQ